MMIKEYKMWKIQSGLALLRDETRLRKAEPIDAVTKYRANYLEALPHVALELRG
jgi:hypothetical protein